MPKEYTKEELWKLYEELPKELQEAIFSMKTADNIYDICERNNIEEIHEVAKYVGYVLVGLLPPEDFQKILEKELELKEEVAKKVTLEVSRFIFFPVRSALEELYKTEITGLNKLAERPEKKEKTEKPDIYRESIE